VISAASQARARSGSIRSEALLIDDLEFAICRILTALVVVIYRDIINVNPGLTLKPSLAKEANSKSLVIIFSSNAKLLLVVLPWLDRSLSVSVDPTSILASRTSARANPAFIRGKWAAPGKLEVICDDIFSAGDDALEGLQNR